jgi:hypothetical protein
MNRHGRAMNVRDPHEVDAVSGLPLEEAAPASGQHFKKARTKIALTLKRRARSERAPRASIPRGNAKRMRRASSVPSIRSAKRVDVRLSADAARMLAKSVRSSAKVQANVGNVHFAESLLPAESSAARALAVLRRVVVRGRLQRDVRNLAHGRIAENAASDLAVGRRALSVAAPEARAAEIVHFAESLLPAVSSAARALAVLRRARVRVHLRVVALNSLLREVEANVPSVGNRLAALNSVARALADLRRVEAAVLHRVVVQNLAQAKAARSVRFAASQPLAQHSEANVRIVQRHVAIAKKAASGGTVVLGHPVLSPKSRADFARTSDRGPIDQFGTGKHRVHRNL